MASVEESRALFAKRIGELLSIIDATQYELLNPELKAVVDHGKAIVDGQSLESRLAK